MIHPTAWIAQGAIVLGDVSLGRDSSIWYQTVIRGDTEKIVVGDETNVQDLSLLHADAGFPCLIGNRVTVGHRVILHGCVVEDDCMIGMGAVLLNGVRIGAGSVVGAGTLLTEGKEIPPGSLVVGSPGRVLRPVGEDLAERVAQAWKHYVAWSRKHRDGEFPIAASIKPGT